MKSLLKFGPTSLVAIVLASTLHAAPDGNPSDADALRQQMQGHYRHVLQLQQTARKDKDVIKLNCVNDKLVQLKPQLNMADRLKGELAAQTDSQIRATTMTSMNELVESVRKLREEADQCVGEGNIKSDSANDFTGPKFPLDPFADPFGRPPVEPPGYASPIN